MAELSRYGLRCAELGDTPGETHDFVLASDFDALATRAGGIDWRDVAVMELVTALRWYAERRNYLPAGGEPEYDAVTARDSFDSNGPGARARHALAIWERDRG